MSTGSHIVSSCIDQLVSIYTRRERLSNLMSLNYILDILALPRTVNSCGLLTVEATMKNQLELTVSVLN